MKLYDKVYYKILLLSENNLILSWLLHPPNSHSFLLSLKNKQANKQNKQTRIGQRQQTEKRSQRESTINTYRHRDTQIYTHKPHKNTKSETIIYK